MNTNTGSIGGTKLVITAPGVTTSSEVEVITYAYYSICESVSIETYGEVTCVTKAEAIYEAAGLLIRPLSGLFAGGAYAYDWAGLDATAVEATCDGARRRLESSEP